MCAPDPPDTGDVCPAPTAECQASRVVLKWGVDHRPTVGPLARPRGDEHPLRRPPRRLSGVQLSRAPGGALIYNFGPLSLSLGQWLAGGPQFFAP